jgi:16S rRNA (guanine966-N2)-methyltransferase
VRIIAGQFRGRVLAVPEGLQTRPMTDRIKETLFNILGARFGVPGTLPDFDALDLFAGTGGLGIEAVSRGARSCIFVERDRRTLPVLRSNISQLKAGDALRVVADNAWVMRLPIADDEAGFGLIFCDPPYRDAHDDARLIDLLDRLGPRLRPDGVIVLRVEQGTDPPLDRLTTLVEDDKRAYGRMRLHFLARRPASGAEQVE